MKIVYVTGDIGPNGNFSFFHDLLVNYPVPNPDWHHKVLLVSPSWDRNLVRRLRERGVEVEACFEEFHNNIDRYWGKIRDYVEQCDVILSGNITNLDEILIDTITKPIISISLAQRGYRVKGSNTYGSFYKPRFHKAAVSKTAVESFPEHVREGVEVVYSGVDPSRLTQKVQREELRSSWFPGRSDSVRLALFMGAHLESKGLKKLAESLDHLPNEWNILVLSQPKDLKIPEHLNKRVHLCSPTYDVADIYLACDCLVLPTEHEGLSMSLLEAWYLGVPVVTTRHKTMLELMAKHDGVDFGTLVDVEVESKELAEAIQQAQSSETARQCVFKHYMASNMVEGWQNYLNPLVNGVALK